MHSAEIERRLRLPAPDEPDFLPALVLPDLAVGGFETGGRVRFGGQVRGQGFGLSPLALAVTALLVAMVGAIASGLVRLDRLPDPFGPNALAARNGIALEYPKGWTSLTPPDPFGQRPSSAAFVLSSVGPIEGCAADELAEESPQGPQPTVDGNSVTVPEGYVPPTPLDDRIVECVDEAPLRPGEVRILVADGPYGSLAGPLWEEAATWDDRIGDGPARVERPDPRPGSAADEVTIWTVAEPGTFWQTWTIRTEVRGPDVAALREEADAVARSLAFDRGALELDDARRDDAVAATLDAIDRESREFRDSDLHGCFPRTPGQRDAVLTSGLDGPLAHDVPVTCSVVVERTVLRLWHITATIAWEDAPGYDAGSMSWDWFADATGENHGGGQRDSEFEVVIPGSIGELPPPLDGPLTIPAGSIVRMLAPGALGANERFTEHPIIGDDLYDSSTLRTAHVVDGPIHHVDTDWYLIDFAQSVAGPNELAWYPAFDEGRPLLEVIPPACPSGAADVAALAALAPIEQLECFGAADLTLAPTMIARRDPLGDTVTGSPDWLADDPVWRLHGDGGVDGVEPPIAVTFAPGLDEPAPGVWLTVTGHFDDPAAVDCRRVAPEAWGMPPEPPAVQVLRCRERFVITAHEPTAAP